jgi:hypothetical protein
MTHGYSLRPNTKGRRRHYPVEGTSTSGASEEGQKPLTDELEGESDTVDPRPATPDTPRAAHNSPAHSRSIITSSIISATTTTTTTTTRYRIKGRRPETWEEIQAARKREEARRIAEAVRIRRVQIGRGYREELSALHARIAALRRECEVKVERARRKWERDWAIERGEVGVVVEEGAEEGNLVGSDSNSEDADADEGEMAVDDNNYAPTDPETSLTTSNDDDHLQSYWSRSESNFPPTLPPLRRTQQQQHLSQSQRQQEQEQEQGDESGRDRVPAGETHTSTGSGSGSLRRHPSQGPRKSQHSRPEHPQPLRRQRAQLMVFPTSSHGLHRDTYGTAVQDPEIRIGGTDGDNDSEMGG